MRRVKKRRMVRCGSDEVPHIAHVLGKMSFLSCRFSPQTLVCLAILLPAMCDRLNMSAGLRLTFDFEM